MILIFEEKAVCIFIFSIVICENYNNFSVNYQKISKRSGLNAISCLF